MIIAVVAVAVVAVAIAVVAIVVVAVTVAAVPAGPKLTPDIAITPPSVDVGVDLYTCGALYVYMFTVLDVSVLTVTMTGRLAPTPAATVQLMTVWLVITTMLLHACPATVADIALADVPKFAPWIVT